MQSSTEMDSHRRQLLEHAFRSFCDTEEWNLDYCLDHHGTQKSSLDFLDSALHVTRRERYLLVKLMDPQRTGRVSQDRFVTALGHFMSKFNKERFQGLTARICTLCPAKAMPASHDISPIQLKALAALWYSTLPHHLVGCECLCVQCDCGSTAGIGWWFWVAYRALWCCGGSEQSDTVVAAIKLHAGCSGDCCCCCNTVRSTELVLQLGLRGVLQQVLLITCSVWPFVKLTCTLGLLAASPYFPVKAVCGLQVAPHRAI